jgi:hypothetical protein
VEDRSVVHEHVDAPVRFERARDDPLPLVGRRHVVRHVARRVADRLRHLLAGLVRDVTEHDARTALGEPARNRGAGAARRTGHDRYLADELVHHAGM